MIKCPYCSTVWGSLVPAGPATLFKARCVDQTCRKRFTVFSRPDPMTRSGACYPVAHATKQDQERDGLKRPYDLTGLRELDLQTLRIFVNERHDMVVAYQDYLDCTLDQMKNYLAKRERESRESAKARARVDQEAAGARASANRRVSKAPADEGLEIDVALRDSLRTLIAIKVKRGKLSATTAEKLLVRLHTRQGMAEAAEAVGMQHMMED